MDNKKNNPNPNPGHLLSTIMRSAELFVEQVQKGEGLNLTADQKKEFKKEMKKQGADKKIADLKKQMQDFKDNVHKMNNEPVKKV